MKVLAGDIGGTNSRLIYAEVDQGKVQSLAEEVFSSKAYTGLLPVINAFLNNQKDSSGIEAACFAVAGPVKESRAHITNLPWMIDSDELKDALGFEKIALINDFQGIGYGLDALSEQDFQTLQKAEVAPQGVRALLGAGTGFGQGILVWQQDHYQVLPSEGGHADFAPRGELEMELLDSMLHGRERVSYDDLLSGRGLLQIYRFLADSDRGTVTDALSREIEQNDPAAAIARYALSGEDALASLALDLFVDIYGAQAGNVALHFLATGGVYIAGGIAPKIVDRLANGRFIDAFINKPPMSPLLGDIPVKVVVNTRAGLLGAALVASRL